MTLKSFFANLLLGDDYKRLQTAASAYWEAYQRLPALLNPGSDILGEMDSHTLDLLSRYTNEYDVLIGGGPSSYMPGEAERIRTVYRSRRATLYDPVTGSIVEMWTNFAFGFNVDVIPRDEAGKEVWDDFYKSRANSYIFAPDLIHELSSKVLTDGELFFVIFVSTVDGECTARLIKTEEIPADGIITDPDDDAIPLYYKRQAVQSGNVETTYYPDWRATDEALAKVTSGLPGQAFMDAREENEKPVPWSQTITAKLEARKTIAVVLHKARDRRKGRGWPMSTAALDWSLAYKDFLQDRAAVAKIVAMIVNKMKVDGGSRAIAAMKSQFGTTLTGSGDFIDRNPPAVAGSTFVANKGVDLERMPLSTGAGDAAMDGASILGMAGTASGNVPLAWLGRSDATTYAIADSQNIPVIKTFNRYQIFWSSVWQDLCEIVLTMAERYNRANFSTYEADINLDSLLETDVTKITGAVAGVWRDVFMPMVGSNKLPQEVAVALTVQAWRVILQALGVKDIDDIIDEEMFSGDEFEPKPVPLPLQMAQNGLTPGVNGNGNGNGAKVPMNGNGNGQAAELGEHKGEARAVRCPGCGANEMDYYAEDGNLYHCPGCKRTYAPNEL